MPRSARHLISGLATHIVQRGIARSPCFFRDADYKIFLEYLGESSQRFGCSIHAYCLMTNHVHLLVTPQEHDGCSQFMKHLSQRYVQTINARLNRTGTLWGGRFHSSLARSYEHVLACYRYIELNPVRAGMVEHPSQYRWSSYHGNTGTLADRLLEPHVAYETLEESRWLRACAYADLCATALPTSLTEEIRKATNAGCVIGARRRRRGRPYASQMRKMGSVPN